METKHTQTPWHVPAHNPRHIYNSSGAHVATVCAVDADGAETRANEALIVRAVNSHDALVEALKLARNDLYETWGEEASDIIQTIDDALTLEDAS